LADIIDGMLELKQSQSLDKQNQY